MILRLRHLDRLIGRACIITKFINARLRTSNQRDLLPRIVKLEHDVLTAQSAIKICSRIPSHHKSSRHGNKIRHWNGISFDSYSIKNCIFPDEGGDVQAVSALNYAADGGLHAHLVRAALHFSISETLTEAVSSKTIPERDGEQFQGHVWLMGPSKGIKLRVVSNSIELIVYWMKQKQNWDNKHEYSLFQIRCNKNRI